MPVIGDGASEDLNPHFFGLTVIDFGESAGDASEGIDFEGIKSLDREGAVVGEGQFGGVDDGVVIAVVDIVTVDFVDLNGGVLGVNLAFDEVLEDFGGPDEEADLTTGGNNFEGEMFLDAVGIFKFFGIT